LTIETPENVVLTYQLAGPSVRCAAYLFDFLMRMVLLYLVLWIFVPLAVYLPGLSVGSFMVSLFLLDWGYFVVCEGFFNGKSVGKHLFGLRVIQEGGTPLSFWSALLRNLARAADAMPFFLHGVGFISMLLTKNFQRVGDLLAGTVVITERRVVLPREPVIVERIEPISREELGTHIPSEQTLTAIDEFLGRRYVLTHERGHQLASVLAGPLANRLGFRGDQSLVEEYPMAFLARVYVTFRQTREDESVEIREPPMHADVRR